MERLILFILTMLILFSCGEPVRENHMTMGDKRIKINAYQVLNGHCVYILDIDSTEYIYITEGCITPLKH